MLSSLRLGVAITLCVACSNGSDVVDAGDATAESAADAPIDSPKPIDAGVDVVADVAVDVEAGSSDASDASDASDGAPACGDGVVTSPEVCDDYNSSACGACSADCKTSQPPVAATGSIIAISGTNLVDGETFTLNDGTQTATVFEFDSNSSVASGHVAVPIFLNSTATIVANAMRTAINGVAGTLLVTASGTGSTVSITNDQQGSFGNVAITETVANVGFVVSGMTGGVGADCPNGTGCGSTTDCQPGLTCTSHTCQ
jgi:cysteine-rich repeat protein